MKKINVLGILLLFQVVLGAPVSQQTARSIADNFLYSKNRVDVSIDSIEEFLVEGTQIFHVMHLVPNGFILVSADDLILPILGFSFENNYKSNDHPINIKWLFDSYAIELTEQLDNDNIPTHVYNAWEEYSQPFWDINDRSVAPLISARFDQGSGWNTLCPDDTDGPSGHALVGCVAVSMSQIMHYWSYPEQGSGSHGYNSFQYGYLNADFGDTFYDFDNMPNNYGTLASQTLLYHAGVAVNMDYGADGSGAWVLGGNPSAYYAMKNYFLFDNSMSYIYPYQYSTSQFRNMLQNEMDNNRPIIYRGYSSDGGHAWNIDGYDDEYFHCNWGWGGYDNGYFLLSTLGGFTSDQAAVINIQPQSLNTPHLILNSYTTSEINGDGDSVINPGESMNLIINIENLVPWNDATSIDLALSSNSEDITIENDFININGLDAGQEYENTNQPFVITASNEIDLSNHSLSLHMFAMGANDTFFEDEVEIQVNVSLYQTGFPYNVTSEVESSPLIIDIDNDGEKEIFFGDHSGKLHGLDANGNSLQGFPFVVPGSSNEIWGAPAGADLDLDGDIEIIFNSKNKHCYVINRFGNIEMDYDAGQYLMGTASIGNVDSDDELEIIFAGYTSLGDVFALNHNGTNVSNFPVQLNEKVLKGVAIYDVDANGKDDIIVATENEKLISIIYDDGSIENIFSADDKFKSIPSILDVDGQIIIMAGNENGHFYGVATNGNVVFDIETGNNVRSSVGFLETTDGVAIFFGSQDGNLYGINQFGQHLPNWPQYIGNYDIDCSPVFADFDNDGEVEIISGTDDGHLIILNLDGSSYPTNLLNFEYSFESSPSVTDIDGDGDLELFFGTNAGLAAIDIKENASNENYWSMYQGNTHRTGYFQSILTDVLSGDLNNDSEINVQDIVITVNIVIGLVNPTATQMQAGDLNSDGLIDVLDIVTLVNLIIG